MRSDVRSWVGLLAVVAVSGACVVRFHGPEDLRRDLARHAGVRLEGQGGVTVGRTGMLLARWIMPDDELSLRGLRRVEVGTYAVRRSVGEPTRPLSPRCFPGWDTVAFVRDGADTALVLSREERGRLRGLLVVVAEPEEWTLVRLGGHLDDLIAEAMRLGFDEARRPDLFAAADGERRRVGSPERALVVEAELGSGADRCEMDVARLLSAEPELLCRQAEPIVPGTMRRSAGWR